MDLDLTGYKPVIREDFSLLVMSPDTPTGDGNREVERIDYSNRADKGFEMSGTARRKIRSSCFGLYHALSESERNNLKFVTLTFPPLPAKLLQSDIAVKFQEDYKRKQAEHNGKMFAKFGGSDDKEKLKDSLMLDLTPKQLEDGILHKLFLKFLDNERKNFDLSKWVWINERQDGERLVTDKKPRDVIHYHCLFAYNGTPNYFLLNLRWLNNLRRNGFSIFNQNFQDESRKAEIIERLRVSKSNDPKESKYDWFLTNWNTFYLLNRKPSDIRKNQQVRQKGELVFGRVRELHNNFVTVRYVAGDAFADKKIHIKLLEWKKR